MNSNLDNNENTGYSIHDLFYIFKKRIKYIILFTIVTFLLSIVYNYFQNPMYRSSGIIMVSEDTNSMSMLSMDFGQSRNFIDNEIAILNSRSTGELVVKELLSRNDTLHILGNKIKSPSISEYIYMLLGFEGIDDSITYNENDLISISTNLRNSMSIYNYRNNDAIKISVVSRDPIEAAYLVNTIVDIYQKQDLSWATGEMSHLKNFITEQLHEKDIDLLKIEKELENFQKKEKIFAIDENATLLLEDLTKFEAQYNNALASIEIINEREKYINSQLTNDEKMLSQEVSNTINQRLLALRLDLTSLENDKISTVTKYGESHSVFKELNLKISDIKRRIGKETRLLIKKGISVAEPIKYRQALMDSLISLRAVKANLESKSNSFQKIVEKYSEKLSLLPEKVLEFTRLERERSVQAQTYKFMSQKLEESRIGEASKLSKIRVIDKGIPVYKPISPKRTQNLLYGIILGLLLSITISILIEFLDNTVRTLEQIERKGLKILALIPSLHSNINKRKSKKYLNDNSSIKKMQRRLITQEDPKSPISESYRGLRTSLMYDENNKDCNIILVSSPGPGEGKTTTVANLAITYANLGKKTLLIDSDLRKPVLHSVFNIDKTPGLTTYLTGDLPYKKIINKTEVDNLYIITSGIIPPNPSEMIDSKKMNDFINSVSKEYDIILFDSPPLIAVTDAFVLMKHINQFILVVRSGISEKGALDRVINTTHQAGMVITGVVMNDISKEHSYGSGYYYNYYEYYYGDSQDKT